MAHLRFCTTRRALHGALVRRVKHPSTPVSTSSSYAMARSRLFTSTSILRPYRFRGLALLWHFCFSDSYEEPFTMGASQGWRAFEEIENGLPDGGHAGLGWRSYDSFFSVPLL